MIRSLLFFLVLTGFSQDLRSQDTLYTKNGHGFEAKVLEVGVKRIRYALTDAPGSAVFIVRKQEIHKISFENGKETIFYRVKKKKTAGQVELFKKNNLSIRPFVELAEGGGFGASYERLVGKEQKIGLDLSIAYVVGGWDQFSSYRQDHKPKAFYLSPGIRIYPFGQNKVSYALGVSHFTGRLKVWKKQYSQYPDYYDYVKDTGFQAGVMVNNYLIFQVSKRFRMSIHAGIGKNYIDRRKTAAGHVENYSDAVIPELGFSFGYCF